MTKKKDSPTKVASPRVAYEPRIDSVKAKRGQTLTKSENRLLRKQIRAIEERLAHLEAALPKERLVILREVSREEAEKDILQLFSQGSTLYYSDIAEQLRLDLKLVVEICNQLQSRGEIQVVDDTLQRR